MVAILIAPENMQELNQEKNFFLATKFPGD
jgi:hypothetical protein